MSDFNSLYSMLLLTNSKNIKGGEVNKQNYKENDNKTQKNVIEDVIEYNKDLSMGIYNFISIMSIQASHIIDNI